MNVLPDYTYVDAQGRGCVTIRPVGTLARTPESAVQLSRTLDELLLVFTNGSPESSYVMLGVVMPPPDAAKNYGRTTLTDAVTTFRDELPVWPCDYTFLAAPPVATGSPRGHSIWVIGWPTPPSVEMPMILRTLESYGLLTKITFRRDAQGIWLMDNVSQRMLARAFRVVQ